MGNHFSAILNTIFWLPQIVKSKHTSNFPWSISELDVFIQFFFFKVSSVLFWIALRDRSVQVDSNSTYSFQNWCFMVESLISPKSQNSCQILNFRYCNLFFFNFNWFIFSFEYWCVGESVKKFVKSTRNGFFAENNFGGNFLNLPIFS